MSQQIVAEVRAKYPRNNPGVPHPLGADHGLFLLEVAKRLGLGLLKKDWGTFVRLPDGTGVSQDCVMEPSGVHYDILSDGEGRAEPRFDLVTKEGTDEPLIIPPKDNRYYVVTGQGEPSQPPAPPQDHPSQPATPGFEPDVRASLGRVEGNDRLILSALQSIQEDIAAIRKANPVVPVVTVPEMEGTAVGRVPILGTVTLAVSLKPKGQP